MPTYAELGFEMPLHQAPADELEAGLCEMCQCDCQAVFNPSWRQVNCPGCGAQAVTNAPCPVCSHVVPYQETRCCHACIRLGRAGWTWTCDVGTIGPAEAEAGRVEGHHLGYALEYEAAVPVGEELRLHGDDVVHFLHDPKASMVRHERQHWEHYHVDMPQARVAQCHSPEEELAVLKEDGVTIVRTTAALYFSRVNPAGLLELLRTPPYHAWQTPAWLFCCGGPMVFVGEWEEADFRQHTPPRKQARRWFMQIVDDAEDYLWDKGGMSHTIGVYMFRCCQCEALRGRWDSS